MTTPGGETARAARNFSALVLASVISKGLLFGWQIALGNLFDPTEYGLYFTIVSLMSVSAGLIGMGMGIVVLREVARQPALIHRYWATMLTLQTAFAGLAYVAVVVTAASSGFEPVVVAYAAVASLSLIVDMFGNISYDLLLAQERMGLTALVEIVTTLLRLGLALAALLAGFGLMGIYGATLLAGGVRSAILCAANWRAGVRLGFPLDGSLTRTLLRDSAPLALGALLALSFQHLDKLMTSAILGPRFTGYLAPAYIITFGVIEIISTTVLVAVFPLLSRSHAESAAVFSAWVGRLARLMLALTLPVALGLSLFALPVVLLLFNEQYTPTVPLLQLLIWATLFMIISNVFSKAMIVQNRQRVSVMIRAGCLVVNIALNALFLHLFRDPRGTAIATLIAEGLYLILLMAAFRAEQFAWRAHLRASTGLVLLGGVSGAAMLLAGQLHWVAGLAAGAAVYSAGLTAGRALPREDWAFLYRFAGALPMGTHIQRLWARVAPVPAPVLD